MARALAAALLIAVATPASAPPVVDERESPRGVFQVSARFFIAAPRPIVFAVLADYAGLPRFVSSVRRSVVERRRPGSALVTQELIAGLFVFRRTVHVRLEIAESPPGRIDFVDLSGRDFRRYHGGWELADAGGGTEVVYSLTVEPRGSKAGAGRVLSTTAATLARQIRDECMRRAHTAPRRIP